MNRRLHEIRRRPARADERIETTLTWPEEPLTEGAVLMSPQPLLGGDMDNNVMRQLTELLARVGLPVLRFNYRSVGQSEPVDATVHPYDYWKGVEEQGDHAAVLEDGREALDRAERLFEPCLLGGYSFGAYVAARVAAGRRLDLPLLLVAPPLGRLDFGFLADRRSPTLLILAADDELDPPPAEAALRGTFPAVTVVTVAGANHFFLGREQAFSAPVQEFLSLIGQLEWMR